MSRPRIYRKVCNSTDEAKWLEARKLGLGSSDMPALMGCGYKDPLRLYAEKIGALEPEDLSDVERVRWGKILEPVVIRHYQERTGRKTTRAASLLQNTLQPWALATLDAWTQPVRAISIPLEIKTTGAHLADGWESGPPAYVRVQVQHQLYVTGMDQASVACLIGGQRFVWVDIERDDAMQREILEVGREFWRRVELRDPPPAGFESGEAVKALYPRDDGSTIILDDSLVPAVRSYLTAKEMQSRAEAEAKRMHALITAAIGAHQTAILPGGVRLTWKTEDRPEYVVKASTRRVLRIQEVTADART